MDLYQLVFRSAGFNENGCIQKKQLFINEWLFNKIAARIAQEHIK